MNIKNVLFGKVDLDTIAAAFVMQVRPAEQAFRAIAGSAGRMDLEEPTTLCLEVGGSGRVGENNFDHHDSNQPTLLSAAAQSLERLAKIIRYVDEMDRGIHKGKTYEAPHFPSLVQLVTGMLICERDPNQQMEKNIVRWCCIYICGLKKSTLQ